MNDEIKKILEELEDNIPIEYIRSCDSPDGLGHYEQDIESWQYLLLDYITNLQQENERLKEELQQEKKDFKEANDYCFELKDYKSRCEKASEYIKSEKEHYLTKGCLIADTNNANLIVSAAVNTCDCSLNILQNGSEEK